jgi:sec-independent protein translocase protein TatA
MAIPSRPLRFGFLNFEEKGLQMIDGLFQPTHLTIVLAIALLIFGGRRLPELGQGLGKGIRSFKDGLRGIDDVPEETGSKTKAQN